MSNSKEDISTVEPKQHSACFNAPIDFFGRVVRESGLIKETDKVVLLISGGADSVSLLLGLVGTVGTSNISALHINYGLRDSADADEELVRRHCKNLNVELEVHKADKPAGNIQAWARDLRFDLAEKLRKEKNADWIAVGHNSSDQVETMLYRLTVSPGVRPLMAMPDKSGYLIRPLMSLSGQEIRNHLKDYVSFAKDPSNEKTDYARNRIRLNVIPELKKISGSVEKNILKTRKELEEDNDALNAIASPVVDKAILNGYLERKECQEQHPAIQRRILRAFAERNLNRPVAVSRELLEKVLGQWKSPEGGLIDIGEGDSFVIESQLLKIKANTNNTDEITIPDSQELLTPNKAILFGDWSFSSKVITVEEAKAQFGKEDMAFFDLSKVNEGTLRVRSTYSGDKISKMGMQGSALLQNVFVDKKVPRSLRKTWPVVEHDNNILWLPNLSVSQFCSIDKNTKLVLAVTAKHI